MYYIDNYNKITFITFICSGLLFWGIENKNTNTCIIYIVLIRIRTLRTQIILISIHVLHSFVSRLFRSTGDNYNDTFITQIILIRIHT